MNGDNRGAILLTRNGGQGKLKHVNIKCFYVAELEQQGKVKVVQVGTKFRHADGLTKALEGTEFRELQPLLGVTDSTKLKNSENHGKDGWKECSVSEVLMLQNIVVENHRSGTNWCSGSINNQIDF